MLWAKENIEANYKGDSAGNFKGLNHVVYIAHFCDAQTALL
jgi:hypothetical protein